MPLHWLIKVRKILMSIYDQKNSKKITRKKNSFFDNYFMVYSYYHITLGF